MGTHLYEHRAEPPRSRLAWLASLGVHAACLALLAYVSWATFNADHAGLPGKEPAVVLGLADSASDDARADEPAMSRSEPPADAQNMTLVDAGAQPLPFDPRAAEPLALEPQLPLDALGGLATAPKPASQGADEGASALVGLSGSGGAGAGARGGSLRLSELADRARVVVFGAVGEGSRFVYVFDRSTSMRGAPLAAAKQQLIGSLDALSSVHQFQVIFFNHQIQAWDLTGGQNRVPFASDRNKLLAAQFVNRVTAAGATERAAPLRRAIALSPDAIFFLTDADDRMGGLELMDVVQRAQRSGTTITCIEFGDGPQTQTQNFLTEIAAQTGGDYVYIDVRRLGAR